MPVAAGGGYQAWPDRIELMTEQQPEPQQPLVPAPEAARARIDAYALQSGRKIRLQIDGGVKVSNIAEIARAGADTFVAGSAVYGAGKEADAHRYDSVIAALRAELAPV